MLTFNMLRAANRARLPLFKNKQGQPAHTAADGSDWSVDRWLKALMGELGEYANISKKIDRGDFTPAEMVEIRAALTKEIADVQIYLDLLAFREGIDLGAAVVQKFNETSDKQGLSVHLLDTPVGWICYTQSRIGIVYEFQPGANRPNGLGWVPLYTAL